MRVVKNNRAVTLVALIITIIILLILAGIIFSSLLGDGGLLRKTSDVGNISKKAGENEENFLRDAEEEIDKWLRNGGLGGGRTVPEEWQESIDSVTSDGVPIPKGFYYVGGTIGTGVVISDNSTDENKGDGHDKILVGNEFVWIPVPDINTMVDKVNMRGKLYDFGTSASPNIPPTVRAYSRDRT